MAREIFRRKKRKKRKKSKKEVQMDLRKEFLAKAQGIERELSTSDNPDSSLTELSELMKDFLREFFAIKYQPTNEELIAELEKKKLKKGVSQEVVRFLEDLTILRYSPTRSITSQTVKKKIGIFMVLVDTIFEATREERAKKEKKQPPLIAKPKEIFQNFVAGAQIVGRWSRHGLELASQRLSQIGVMPPKVGAEYVMEQLARGYDALEDEKVRQAERCLERIEKKLVAFTLEDQKAVEREITAFKRELSLYVEKPRLKIPLSSAPEAARPKARPEEKVELPTGGEIDAEELERFVRLALGQNVSPPLIRERLLQNGWPASQINLVFRRFSIAEKQRETEGEPEAEEGEDADEMRLFIKRAMDNNIPLPVIRERLLEDGWPASLVDRAFTSFSDSGKPKARRKVRAKAKPGSGEGAGGGEMEKFIKQAMKRGIPLNSIRKQLLRNGWPAAEVDKATRRFSR